MKTKKTYWKRVTAVLLVSIISAVGVLYSCEKENIQPIRQDSIEKGGIAINEPICGTVITKDLYDKENKRYGTVSFHNDARFLYVKAVANRGHAFKNAYLFVGSREELPLNVRGDIQYKSFKNFTLIPDLVHEHNFQFPLAGLPRSFMVSFMTQVPHPLNDENTLRYANAWADGKMVGDQNGGRIFIYKRAICKVDIPEEFDQ